MSRWILIAGCILVAAGVIMHLAPWLVGWFGKLPGDIRIESEKGRIFIPVTSMLIISVILTLLVNLFRR